MRWDELFADLEGQLEAGLGADERDAQAEEERLRLGRLTLRDRLAGVAAAFPGEQVRVELVDGRVLGLAPATIGRDWVAGATGGGGQAVLPMQGVAALLPTAAQAIASLTPPPPGALTDRLGLPFMLRDLCRRRRAVEVVTRSGVVQGTFDRVGRDHADLAVHPLDGWRRAGDVVTLRVVALAELVLVRVP